MRPAALFLFLVLFCASCTDRGELEKEGAAPFRVDILFDPGGLGDRGYNDSILRGILQTAKKYDLELSFHSPDSLEAGWRKYEKWLAELPDQSGKSLFIFASQAYERLLRASAPGRLENGSLLVIESEERIDNVASFRVDLYGGSYCIGRLAGTVATDATVVLANSENPHLRRCAEGFAEGFEDAVEGAQVETICLSSDVSQGYDRPDETYHLAYSLFQTNQFVFPVAGGSNMGIYKYTRDHPDQTYTAGIDADMSIFSTQVVASLIKRIDLVLDNYVGVWKSGEELPDFAVYGLDSEFVDVLVAPRYSSRLEPMLDDLMRIGIEKEKAYVE